MIASNYLMNSIIKKIQQTVAFNLILFLVAVNSCMSCIHSSSHQGFTSKVVTWVPMVKALANQMYYRIMLDDLV